jgi:hypothetical protein
MFLFFGAVFLLHRRALGPDGYLVAVGLVYTVYWEDGGPSRLLGRPVGVNIVSARVSVVPVVVFWHEQDRGQVEYVPSCLGRKWLLVPAHHRDGQVCSLWGGGGRNRLLRSRASFGVAVQTLWFACITGVIDAALRLLTLIRRPLLATPCVSVAVHHGMAAALW